MKVPMLKDFYAQITKKRALLNGHQFILQFFGPSNQNSNGSTESQTGGNDAVLWGPAAEFSYYAHSATIPSPTLNKADVNYYAGRFTVPTTVTFEHNWTTKILVDQGFTLYNALRSWQEDLSSYYYNSGGRRVIPNMNIRIKILNAEHDYFTTAYVLAGVWPKQIQSQPLKYEQTSNPTFINVQFSYQYCYEDTTFNASENPLKP